MPIDWAFLRERGGENFESLLATLLRREFPDLRQVNPAQGDSGVDLVRETADGAVVFQVKVFTTAPNSSQLAQIKRSWDTFVRERPYPRVASYTLVTPWTPTQVRLDWFRELTSGAGFPTTWEAAAFLNGLAARYPDVIALYERGSRAFEDQITARALLAGSDPRASDLPMAEAIEQREAALREIRDDLHPHYLINVSERTSTTADQLPLPGPNEAGVMYRYEQLDGQRYRVQAVVPRHADAMRLDPIQGRITLRAEPGSPQAQQYEDLMRWGLQASSVEVEMVTTGGPFAPLEGPASISITPQPVTAALPDIILGPDGCLDTPQAVRLRVVEATAGAARTGARLVCRSLQGAFTAELRLAFDDHPSQFTVTLATPEGKDPASLLREVAWIPAALEGQPIVAASEDDAFRGRIRDMAGSEELGQIYTLLKDLSDIQPHTEEPLVMVPLDTITFEEGETIARIAALCRGETLEGTWSNAVLDLPEGTSPPEIVDGQPLTVTQPIQFTLAGRVHNLRQHVRVQYASVRVAAEAEEPASTGIRLVPGPDDCVALSIPLALGDTVTADADPPTADN